MPYFPPVTGPSSSFATRTCSSHGSPASDEPGSPPLPELRAVVLVSAEGFWSDAPPEPSEVQAASMPRARPAASATANGRWIRREVTSGVATSCQPSVTASSRVQAWAEVSSARSPRSAWRS